MAYFMGMFQAKWAATPPHLTGETIFYRGQTDITHRILPTRLRGPKLPAAPRFRYPVPAPPDVPEHEEGNWFEQDPEFRSHEKLVEYLLKGELQDRDAKEQAALNKIAEHPELRHLSVFQQRAAARHYAGVPSSLLDVTTDLEVAAFFATGAGEPVAAGQLGMLWAMDMNFLKQYFGMKVRSLPEGWIITLKDRRDEWGDNKKILDEFGLLPGQFNLHAVELKLPRPQAQKGRFISLETEDGKPLPPESEVLWWSMLERWLCPISFIQDGSCYTNEGKAITKENLLPKDDPYLALGS